MVGAEVCKGGGIKFMNICLVILMPFYELETKTQDDKIEQTFSLHQYISFWANGFVQYDILSLVQMEIAK